MMSAVIFTYLLNDNCFIAVMLRNVYMVAFMLDKRAGRNSIERNVIAFAK